MRYVLAAKDAGCPEDQVRNFARFGIVLQPRQLLASAAARECDEPDGPNRVAYGGARGGGKSHWGLAQVICDDCQRFPGLKFLYLRKVGKAGREAIQDLRREVLHSTPHEYRSQEGLITLPNGSRVVIGHFQHDRDVDNYLGLQYDGALIEEATQLAFQKVRDIGTCIRTSKPGWRPRRYFTTNPGNIGHAWFKNMFIDPLRQGLERDTRFVQATVYDNRFINPEYRAELESLSGWQRRAYLLGDWDIAAGQFFTNFRRELGGRPHHVIPGFPIPRNWQVWCALDYGFTHYTTVYLLAKSGDGDVFIVDEHAQRGWLPMRHAPAILSMLERNGFTVHHLTKFVASPDIFGKMRMTDEGLTLAEQYNQLLGIELERANDDRINGAGEFLSRLGDSDAVPAIPPRLFIFERCRRLIDCLPSLVHDPHRPEDVLKVDTDDNGFGGDDPYDGARYGLMVDYVTRRPQDAQALPVASTSEQYAGMARYRGSN